jgi:polyhydroxyalkanoate synthesis regulator protein
VLTQVILEDAKGQPTGLPLELLRQLIVASDQAGKEFLMWYLKSAFDAYGKVQESVESRLNDVKAAAMTPINLVKNLLAPAGESELEYLRRRVAELEARLEKPAAPKKRPRR